MKKYLVGFFVILFITIGLMKFIESQLRYDTPIKAIKYGDRVKGDAQFVVDDNAAVVFYQTPFNYQGMSNLFFNFVVRDSRGWKAVKTDPIAYDFHYVIDNETLYKQYHLRCMTVSRNSQYYILFYSDKSSNADLVINNEYYKEMTATKVNIDDTYFYIWFFSYSVKPEDNTFNINDEYEFTIDDSNIIHIDNTR